MRGPIQSLFQLISIFLLIIIFTPAGFAGEWRISPIRIELSPKDKSSSITVYNEDRVSLNFKVKAMQWIQDENGKDIYEETEDIIFFPKVFTLNPNKERLIRIGIKNKDISPLKEKTYRLFIEEIPPEPKEGAVAVQIALRFGIPIFVKPLKEETKWEVTRKTIEKGNILIEIKNRGNHHFQIHYLKLKGFTGDKEVITKELSGWYVLAGAKRVFSERIEDCNNIDRIFYQIVTDRFSVDDHIQVYKENCNP